MSHLLEESDLRCVDWHVAIVDHRRLLNINHCHREVFTGIFDLLLDTFHISVQQ